MAQVTIETVADPVWWNGATTVQVTTTSAETINSARADVELLPEGVSLFGGGGGLLIPWDKVSRISKLT